MDSNRSLSLKGLDPLVSKFTKITKGIAKAYGCEVEVKIPFSVDPVVNDEKATVFATKVAQEYTPVFNAKILY